MQSHPRTLRALTLGAFLLAAPSVFASGFTAGNVVVVRIGDGSAPLSSASTAVFLEEYTPAGALVQTVALPTAAAGRTRPSRTRAPRPPSAS